MFVLGKSGSGKSTLLNVLGGLDRADEGQLIVRDKSDRDFKNSDYDSYRNTYVGFVFQEFNLLEDFTVGQNIALALKLLGKPFEKSYVEEILKKVDLEGYYDRKTNELSGGQKQRVAIARALVKEPQIILADEPTGALDSVNGALILETLKNISKTCLVVVVSHDRDFAVTYADRIIELKDGKVVSDLTKNGNQKNGDRAITFDEKGIFVAYGQKLSKEDLATVKDYISNQKKGAKIVVEVDTDIKEGFKPTDKNDIKQSQKKYTKVKTKLSYLSALKSGFATLKYKPIRLVIIILLSVMAFCMFGIVDTFNSFNIADSLTQSYIDSGEKKLVLSKSGLSYIPFIDYYIENGSKMLNDNDIKVLSLDGDILLQPLYTEQLFLTNFALSLDKWKLYYSYSVYAYADIDYDMFNTLGFTLSGNLPTAENEIALTKYNAQSFVYAGYIDELNNEIKFETENDLIGKSINLYGKYYTVTGIADTGFDEEKYAVLKDYSDGSSISDLVTKLSNELKSSKIMAIHNLCFVTNSFLERFDCQNYVDTLRYSFSLYNEISLFKNVNLKRIYSFNQNLYHSFAAGKTALSEGECLLPISSIYGCSALLNEAQKLKGIPDNFKDTALAAINSACDQYADSSYDAAVQNGFVGNTGKYKQYLNSFFVNDYGENTYAQIALNVMTDYFNSYDVFTKAASANSKLTFYHNIGEVYVNPIGFFVPDYFYDRTYDTYNAYEGIVFNDRAYNKLTVDGIEGKYDLAISLLPDNKVKTRQFIDICADYISPDNTFSYGIEDSVYTVVAQIYLLKLILLNILIIIGVFLTAFAVALMLNLISVTIANKKNQIGILRAMGASGGDVFKIFSVGSIVIAFISFVLSIIGTLVLVGVFNSLLKKFFEMTATILVFSLRQIILLFVVSFFTAVLGSFFPILKISKKRPTEVINH